MKKFIYVALAFDALLFIFSAYKSKLWLINSQLSFISSMFIALSSYLSYKKMVNQKVQNYESQEQDLTDKILDPYELDEEENKENKKSKIEKVKKSLSDINQTKRGFLAPLRLFSYGFIVLVFFVLVKNQLFYPLAFFIGLSIMPTSVLTFSLLQKN